MENLEKYQFVILPARPPLNFGYRHLYNAAYLHWRTYWQRIFERKAPDFWDPHDFFRQDLVSCVFYEDKIAAQNISTFLHVDDLITYDLEYFKTFHGEALSVIKEENAKTIMTIEYTSVYREFGERHVGIALAQVINGLGLKLFQHHGVDVTTGTPRSVSGLSEVTENYGYRRISGGIKKAGWVLDCYLGFRDEVTEHADDKYRWFINHLWAQRQDLSGLEGSRSPLAADPLGKMKGGEFFHSLGAHTFDNPF